MTQLTRPPARELVRPSDHRPVRFVVGCALLAIIVLATGSSPGASMLGVAITAIGLVVAVVRAVSLVSQGPAPRQRRLVAALIGFTLIGVSIPLAWTGRPFEARFAAATEDFAAVAAQLPQQPVKAGYRKFKPYPGECPRTVGSFTIEKCHTFRGGWLLVDSTSPVSDQAGFYYRPGLSRVDVPDAGLTHLEGDWYSWRQEPMN